MMQDFTYHTHNNTQGIGDGYNSCEEMITKAEELSFSEIGVSNHLIYHPSMKIRKLQDFCDFNKALDFAKKSLDETREVASRHKIKVYAGFEVDFYPSAMWRKAFERMLKELEVDYLIGSIHNLFNQEETEIFSNWVLAVQPNNELANQLLPNYWQNIIDCINSGYFDFIAHFDLPCNLGVCQAEDWQEWIAKVVEAFKQTKMPFEVNTNGMRRCGVPSPGWDIVKELVTAGVPTLISDDAHSVDWLGQYFAEAEAKLAEFGCTERFRL